MEMDGLPQDRARVRKIAAGESHSLLLTASGEVFAWGKGLFGRLGTGSTADQITPVLIAKGDAMNSSAEDVSHVNSPSVTSGSFFPTVKDGDCHKVVDIATGAYHSLALTEDGIVRSWGYNIHGQLGQESDDDSYVPRPVSHHESHEDPVLANGQLDKDRKISKVISVEAGGMMSCAIDQSGLLWMWGDCPMALSSNVNSSLNIPRPVLSLQQFRVLKVSCGSQHVLTLVSRGDTSDGSTGVSCYAWGSNKYGQLGLGDKQRREQPQHVIALNEPCVGMLTDIACGAYHSAVLTCNARWDVESSDRLTSDGDAVPSGDQSSSKRKGMCWTFGLGENGQLGHGNTRCLDLPEMIHNLPEDEILTHVACGLFHMGVVTESGDVWTWGMEMGLGLCPGIGPPGAGAGDYLSPVKVFGYYGFDSSRGEKMTCGAAHTVLVTNEGSALWAWGRGENGVLGTGQLTSSLTPVSVVWPPSCAAAGTENALLIPKQSHKEVAVDEEDEKQKLISLAQREICTLTTELAAAKHSMAVLQAAVYGSLDPSEPNLTRDVLQDWKKTIETSSYDDLVHLDSFYREVHSHVKEVLLKRKVEKLCRECLEAMKSDNTVDVAKSIVQQIE